MGQTLVRILIVVAVAILAVTILTYMGIIPPFGEWSANITGFFSNLGIDKIPLTVGTLIGGLGAAVGAAGGLGFLYNKTKGALKQTQTALTSTNQKVESLVSSNNSLSTEKAALQTQTQSTIDKIALEKQAALKEASELKTQVSTMQQNYNSVDAQKAQLLKQIEDMKAQSLKAQAQLDVLVPRVR